MWEFQITCSPCLPSALWPEEITLHLQGMGYAQGHIVRQSWVKVGNLPCQQPIMQPAPPLCLPQWHNKQMASTSSPGPAHSSEKVQGGEGEMFFFFFFLLFRTEKINSVSCRDPLFHKSTRNTCRHTHLATGRKQAMAASRPARAAGPAHLPLGRSGSFQYGYVEMTLFLMMGWRSQYHLVSPLLLAPRNSPAYY